MKTLKFLIIAGFALLIAGCGSNKNPELTGVYVNESKNEFSIAKDTLIIKATSLTDKAYSIENRTTFQKIRNGQIQAAESKIVRWNAFWQTEQQVLSEGELGRQIRLSPDKKGIVIKNTLYKKID